VPLTKRNFLIKFLFACYFLFITTFSSFVYREKMFKHNNAQIDAMAFFQLMIQPARILFVTRLDGFIYRETILTSIPAVGGNSFPRPAGGHPTSGVRASVFALKISPLNSISPFRFHSSKLQIVCSAQPQRSLGVVRGEQAWAFP
jgi:hypothetical protein